ncbi:MAG: hypothetical protein GX892_03710 [Thermoanaerobacteraceae bacterium]|nr:hypothetical protein [Thermoanaerobacteraceae bacterium]
MNETLIKYVNEIGSNEKFWESEYKNTKNAVKDIIGSNNLRQLAVLALNADCYEEFKLFMQYKTAKGNGWDSYFDKEKKERFGDVIISYLDKIYEASNKNDDEALNNISRFFGYLFWRKRVIGGKGEKSK